MTLRHLLADDDLSPQEQKAVLDLAADLKASPYSAQALRGPRTIALVFDKPTLRTQTSFSAGVAELGGFPMVVDGRLAGIGERESIEDVARVLGRQAAAVVWRTSAQARMETLARHAGVPVVNALTDDYHPCQLLADLLTLRERFGDPAGRTVAFLGDGACNMAHSWLLAGATAGMHVRIGAPLDYAPRGDVLARAETIAAGTGGSVRVVEDPLTAASGADVLATDTWTSMGREEESERRIADLAGHRVDGRLLDAAAPEAVVLHCLPAYRGQEISADVLEGPRSLAWDEAENRRHAQKAVLVWLLEQAEAR